MTVPFDPPLIPPPKPAPPRPPGVVEVFYWTLPGKWLMRRGGEWVPFGLGVHLGAAATDRDLEHVAELSHRGARIARVGSGPRLPRRTDEKGHDTRRRAGVLPRPDSGTGAPPSARLRHSLARRAATRR